MDLSKFNKEIEGAATSEEVIKILAIARAEILHEKGFYDDEQYEKALKHIAEGRYTEDDYFVWLLEKNGGNVKGTIDEVEKTGVYRRF